VGYVNVVGLGDAQDRGAYGNLTQVAPKNFLFRILRGFKVFKGLVNRFVEVKDGLVWIGVLAK
jgi:hypothetical protein